MIPAARILDANFNRAREALRVMEDAARFALDDAALCGELKSIRHELRAAVAQLVPPGVMEANRDTPGDVGAAITTDAEMHRHDLLDVVIAAGKRLSESLRVIEEMSKITQSPPHAAGVPARVEALRYRAYTVDAQLQLRFGSGRAQQWTLCLVLTTSLCEKPWQQVLADAIRAGADCVQVREKDMNSRELVTHVKEVRQLAKPHAIVIVNDRADIALAAGADGVHLGQDDLAIHDVRRIAGRNLIVGVSAHHMNEAHAAVQAGADYCGIGTMFASTVKPHLDITGPAFAREFVLRFPRTPHLAIGGITPDNIHHLTAAGVRGIAVSSAICAAADPFDITQLLVNAMANGNSSEQPALRASRSHA